VWMAIQQDGFIVDIAYFARRCSHCNRNDTSFRGHLLSEDIRPLIKKSHHGQKLPTTSPYLPKDIVTVVTYRENLEGIKDKRRQSNQSPTLLTPLSLFCTGCGFCFQTDKVKLNELIITRITSIKGLCVYCFPEL